VNELVTSWALGKKEKRAVDKKRWSRRGRQVDYNSGILFSRSGFDNRKESIIIIIIIITRLAT
jgi:hypothetical protein